MDTTLKDQSQAKLKSQNKFLMAIKERNFECLEEMLSQGFDLNEKYHRDTYLYAAVEHEFEDVVAFLLEHGADVNITSEHSQTPLLSSIRRGHKGIFDTLIQYNPDTSICSEGYETTALHYAAQSNFGYAVEVLLSKGQQDLEKRVFFWKETPLLQAVRYGSESAVKALLKHGADYKAKNCNDRNAIEEAVYKNDSHVIVTLKKEIYKRESLIARDEHYATLTQKTTQAAKRRPFKPRI